MSSLLVFNRVYELEIQSVMLDCWYFRPSFVSYFPSNLFFWFTPPLPKVKVQYVYTDSVWLGGGGGVEFCWRPYSAGV
jgi:hypothetical protein